MSSAVAPLIGHLDAALSNYAIRYRNNDFVADRVAPRLGVPRESDKYYVYGKEGMQLTEKVNRAHGSPAQRIRRTLSSVAYSCKSHALAADIPDEDRAGYPEGRLEQDTTDDLIQKILLNREKELATMLADTGQVTQNVTLSGTDQWSDYANSAPFTNVETAKAKLRNAGIRPSFMMVSDAVFSKLINHPAVIDRFKYRQAAINEADLALAFGVPNFYVAMAVEDIAGTFTPVFGKHAWIGYASPAPTRMDLSGAKTFVWENAPGTVGGIGTLVGRYPDVTAKGDTIGVDFYYQMKITAVEGLYLIKNAVA